MTFTTTSSGSGGARRSPCPPGLFLAGLLAGCLVPTEGWAETAHPISNVCGRPLNVIVLFTDDMGWGDLGVQGHPFGRTPTVYADGSQEFYDRRSDPHEFNNLAVDPALAYVIREHREWRLQISHRLAKSSAYSEAKTDSAPDINHRPVGAGARDG